jgi:protein disulfide-isomerase
MGYVAPVTTPPPAPITLPSPASATGSSRYAGHLPSFRDYDQALAAARSYHAPLLVLFTGSDWCPYCQKLDQEVLSTPDFQSYVAGHFVFVTIDDLRNTPVPDDEKKQITDLERKFNVHGFPSMLVLDNHERTIGGVEGYEPSSGPSAVTGKLDAIAAKFTN